MMLLCFFYEMALNPAPRWSSLSKNWTGTLLVCFLISFSSSFVWGAGLVYRCAKAHTQIEDFSTESQDWGFQVDQIAVTGGSDYPLKEVLRSLHLNSKWIQAQKNSQASVISLAEGTSDLLPYLLQNNLNAFGSDLWYFSPALKRTGAPQVLLDFMARWSSRLFASDAKDMVLASETVGSVLSHKLFNNLHIADSLRILTEVIRILEVGGEARISDISPYAFRTIGPFLSENYQGLIDLRHEGNLLVIQKKKSTKALKVPQIPFDRDFRYQGVPNGTRTFDLPFAPRQVPAS